MGATRASYGLGHVPGRGRILTDTMEEGNRPDIFIEFLRAQNPSGLPPTRLELKIGTPVICLRNLFPRERLYNKTRIIITKLREYSIKVKIIGGQFHGKD
jgi:PIF1-like helicase